MSFWTGMLWLAYERTGDPLYRDVAKQQIETFQRRLREGNTSTHELGFLYTLSGVAATELTGSALGRRVAIDAADRLTDRYLVRPGIVQAWGSIGVAESDWGEWVQGRTIVDTTMSLPLLYWAAETTGRQRYRDLASTHARTASEYLIRDDGSTYHTFGFDPATGDPVGGETHQGFADDSCWSRGQAWTIYGFALAYGYTGDEQFREAAVDVADYYLDSLPADVVPAWDFDAGEDQRDSSAAAIAACGLAELSEQLPLAAPQRHRNGTATRQRPWRPSGP